MNYPCFVVEKTGNTRIVHEACETPGCNCGGYDREEKEFIRLNTGETLWRYSYYSLPPGAMWLQEMWDIHTDLQGNEIARYKGNGDWNNDDGFHLHVMLPGPPNEDGTISDFGHPWDVDSRANNCTLPDDRIHRCWVREGTQPNVSVSKNGHTCAAGAGSIRVAWWHGFLRNGILEEC